MNLDYNSKVEIVKILTRLVDEFYFLEDQLEMERHPETARFGPMSSEEEAGLKEFNKGYKKCLTGFIRCIPFPLGHHFMVELKELFED